jgi:hypothetical protein
MKPANSILPKAHEESRFDRLQKKAAQAVGMALQLYFVRAGSLG